jgi:hypothetical protein
MDQFHRGAGYQGAEKNMEFSMTSSLACQPSSCPAPLFSSPASTTKGLQQRRRRSEEEAKLNSRTVISLRDPHILRCYYSKVFENLQQVNCRLIAKAYVKLVEPHKQVLYPYNGRKTLAGNELTPDETKPLWWPPGVRHREPDHLLKAGNTMDLLP